MRITGVDQLMYKPCVNRIAWVLASTMSCSCG